MPLSQFTSFRLTRRASSGERGASMVEISLVLPLFLVLIFGIMEFSYAFAQNNEIRHVARHAARQAAVDPGANMTNLVCNSFNLIGTDNVAFEVSAGLGAGNTVEAGETAAIRIQTPYTTLTGFFDGMFAGANLESEHNFLVEQPVGGGAAGWLTPDWVPCP